MLFMVSQDDDEKAYCRYEAKRIRKEIIANLEIELSLSEIEDRKWSYATIATCFAYLGDIENEQKYEELFLNESPEKWEMESYASGKPR